MNDASIRIAQIQKKMIEKGMDALLLAKTVHVQYLSGVPLMDGMVLLTTREVFFLLDGRYDTLGRKVLHHGKVVRFQHDLRSWKKLVHKRRWKKVGYDTNSSTVLFWLKKLRPHTHFVLFPQLVEEIRIIKSAKEINSIWEACSLSSLIYEEVKESIRWDMSEWEIQKLIRKIALEHDVLDFAFDAIVAVGKHTSYPHYILAQQQRTLQPGDVILIDMGVTFQGYKSDMTRMIFVGKPSKVMKKWYTTILDIQEKIIDTIRPGNKISDTVLLYQHLMKKAGLYRFVRHALGHGVGLEIHEAPALTVKNHDCWTPGMVVAIEPGMYHSHQFGIRIEDTVMVGKRGPIVLTSVAKDVASCTIMDG